MDEGNRPEYLQFGEGNGTPLQYCCLENPTDRGAWKAAVHGIAEGQTRLSDFTFNFHFPLSCIGEGNGNPLQCSCLENPRDGGAWWAAVYGVAQSWTWLKRLSSNSSGSSSSSSNVLWYISVLIWMKSNLYIFIVVYIFGIISKKSLLNAILWSFSPVFSSTTFIVLLIALKVFDPFGLNFVEGKLSLFHCWILYWLCFFYMTTIMSRFSLNF